MEVVGSNPAVPTNPFNNLAGSTQSAFAAFCGKSSEEFFSPSFRQHRVHRSDHLLNALREFLLAAARTNPAIVLREAAATYKVDTDAIALKVQQDFAAKQKARKTSKPTQSAAAKAKKAA